MSCDFHHLMMLDDFKSMGWEEQFQSSMRSALPRARADQEIEVRCGVLLDFVRCIVVNINGVLGSAMIVESAVHFPGAVFGSIDFGDDTPEQLLKVAEQEMIAAGCETLPDEFGKGAILDRLLSAAVFVIAPDGKTSLAQVKNRFVSRFRRDGSIAGNVEQLAGKYPKFRIGEPDELLVLLWARGDDPVAIAEKYKVPLEQLEASIAKHEHEFKRKEPHGRTL